MPRFTNTLDLVALPTAVPITQLFISHTLHQWRAVFIESAMQAIAIKLVSFAVEATGPAEGTRWTNVDPGPIEVRLLGYQKHIVIEVADAHHVALVPPDDPGSESAAGLRLVEATASRWGSFPTLRGRVMWAELAVYERTTSGLPQRPCSPLPRPRSPAEWPASQHDPDFLRRVRDGLTKL